MTSAPLVSAAAPPRGPEQRWVIGLGWFGFGLWALEWLTDQLHLETTVPTDVRMAYHVLQVLTGWLWPVALSLHLYRLVKPVWLRDTLAGLAAFLVAPAIGYSLVAAGLYYLDHDTRWKTEQVLFRRPAAPATVVARQVRVDQFTLNYPGYRVVQLTPVLGLWQRVQPVDTTRFDAAGWQRVRR